MRPLRSSFDLEVVLDFDWEQSLVEASPYWLCVDVGLLQDFKGGWWFDLLDGLFYVLSEQLLIVFLREKI